MTPEQAQEAAKARAKAKLKADAEARRAGVLPGGYLRGAALRGADCSFAEGVLSIGRRGVRLTIAPEKVGVRTPVQQVNDVAFRDDFSRFMLPNRAAQGWEPGAPLVVDMPEESFPPGLRQRFALAPRLADITVTRHGIFVAPGAAIAPPMDPVAEPEPEPVVPLVAARAKRPRILTPFRLALVALTGVGLMTGSVIRAVDLPGRTAVPMATELRIDR